MYSEDIWVVVGGAVLSLPFCLASISFKCKNIDGQPGDVTAVMFESAFIIQGRRICSWENDAPIFYQW